MDGAFMLGGGTLPRFPPIGCGLNCPGMLRLDDNFGGCLLGSPPILKSILGLVGFPL